ncbi:MAG TPA: DUF4376 domain-containing protein [Methanosarcina sp.]|nr:DUF4376 domain-containing protein [Methanosarcina sp.]
MGDMVAHIDPLDGTPMLMSYSTTKMPPVATTNQRAVFLDIDGNVPMLESDGKWKVIPDYRGETYWLSDGTEVPITDLGVTIPKKALRSKPISLQESKDTKWNEIKSQRDQHEFGCFTWNNYAFDANQVSQSRIMLAVMGAQIAIASNQNWSVDWRLADNTLITLSASDMLAVAEAMGQNTKDVHEHANQLRELIDAATTNDAVGEITW